MEHRQLEYLVTLTEERHFTRAAERCRVSQSGLSAAIRRLEQELDAKLFERTTRSVEPTPAALALLPHAREILAQTAAGRDAVVRASHQLAGSLRIGAEQCLGALDVNLLLERFHRRHPAVDIQFVQAGSHQLVDHVAAGELDVAFVASADPAPVPAVAELARIPLVLIVPAAHPLAERPVSRWKDLRDADFVDFRPAWALRTINDDAFQRHGVERRVRCSVDDVHTLLDLVVRGLGVAIVPQHVANKPQAKGLVALPVPAGAPEWIVSTLIAGTASLAPRLLEILDEERAEAEAA
ncbi:DNA-binding transcriptional LysR family regulator [Microbacterium trichothecenolyticum]|uniref:LysR family transcriptional regulator n=1 Tax=Microbacterium trichothecenolyticum TaxID=69370 RepID=UPI00286012A3|nr:LysR substrate-binding domain-containing protein [Microbacterium trichothecenolyticum]MDR7184116.1 DNA-binding transcriptional LysR family regulator [Microbacterium trichothecenolyticum]